MAPPISDRLTQKLDDLNQQFEQFNRQLTDPDVLVDHQKIRSLSIKRSALDPIITKYRHYLDAQQQIADLETIIAEDDDAEMIQLARSELHDLQQQANDTLEDIQRELVRADDQSVGSIIMEIRAGVGGDEAGIWAGDLATMYQRYAADKGWNVETLDFSPAEHGGCKSAILNITGEGVWAQLEYEGGTHQVKRVPLTEAQGRVHTSTATVAVLPEPEEIEVQLDPNDVKESITTSQGPGGQNVNKVATAVHLIHEPTGIEVRMQDTKSQAQNRVKAWQLLRARLYEQQRMEAEANRAESRNSMIGSGNRAEKIRTYRFKDNIAVDHRIGESFNLGEIMNGHLQPLIDKLVEHDTAQRLAAL